MNWKKPPHISELLSDFTPEKMSPGLRRGMVLRVYKPVIKKLIGRQDFAEHITKEYLTGEYTSPALVIITDQSAWKYQLHLNRNRIRDAINERLGINFIKKVIIK